VASWALFFFFFLAIWAFFVSIFDLFCGLEEEREWASLASFVGILGLFSIFFFFFVDFLIFFFFFTDYINWYKEYINLVTKQNSCSNN
jgi:hypothetical protein